MKSCFSVPFETAYDLLLFGRKYVLGGPTLHRVKDLQDTIAFSRGFKLAERSRMFGHVLDEKQLDVTYPLSTLEGVLHEYSKIRVPAEKLLFEPSRRFLMAPLQVIPSHDESRLMKQNGG